MKKYIKVGYIKIIVGFVILAVLAAGAIFVKEEFFTKEKTTEIGFKDMSELITQSAYCTEIIDINNPRQYLGIDIPFTNTHFIFSYDIKIDAGLDFSQIECNNINHDTKTIDVHMPDVEILGNNIDTDSLEIYLEDESIFNRFDLSENNEAMKLMQENAEKDAIDNGLLENAEANAKILIENFIHNMNDYKDYTINFVD